MNQPCTIELLGGLQVRIGERVITRFRTQKTAALLGFLAYFLDRSHPREEIIEVFWPDADPRDSRASLRTALSSLRHQLEPPGTPFNSVLVTDRANIGLNPRVVSTDVAQFDEAIAAAARASEPGEREQALCDAIRLYRGPLMPGFYEEWMLRERERLEQRYLGALGALADLAAARGDLGRAIEVAMLRVDAAPLDEECHDALIALLEAGGRPVAAQEQRDKRERAFQSDAPAPPVYHGHAVAAASPPPPPPPSTHLPITLTAFFGREDERRRVRDLLRGGARLVTLTGPGGAGKTRLSIEAARELDDVYAGRIWFVPLADTADPGLILDSVLSALNSQPPPSTDRLEQIAETLGREPALLVLDNFEQLADRGAPVVMRLIGRLPNLALLISSRQQLDLDGEWRVPLMPLPVPPAPGTPERLLAFPSVRLFVDRAQAARPDFQITADNGPGIAALCERLEGIPLALELAAAWAAVLTPSQMLARMNDRFAFLESRRRGVARRHQTLRDAIDWSYRLLNPELQQFFRALSVFRGGWSLEAAEAVCGGPAQRFLQQLHDRSLVVSEESGAEMRFRLLESLREFAASALVESGEEAATRQRHRDYFLGFAEAMSRLPHAAQAEALVTLEREHDNLRAALRYSVDAAEQESGLRMAVALARFWEVRGHFAEGRRWLAELLGAGEPVDARLRARGMNAAGTLAWQQGDYSAARTSFGEGLALSRHEDYRQGIADSLHGLGVVAEEQADFEAARGFLEESIAIKRDIGDRKGLASSLNTLANAASGPGDYDTARRLYHESLTLVRALGDMRGVSLALNNLAIVAYGQGDYGEARRLLEETLQIKRVIGDLRGISICLNNLGELAWREGDFDSAQSYHDEGIAIRRQLGDRHGIATSLAQLATLAASRGDYHAAWSLYGESVSIRQELDDRYGIADCLELMARLAAHEQAYGQAAVLFGAAEALRDSIAVALPPIDVSIHEEAVSALRARMEERDFRSAWQAGREMTVEQAIQVSLNASGQAYSANHAT